MAGEIVFYLEFSSPYVYVAAQEIDELAERYGRRVLWRPISLGHVWKAIGYDPASAPRQKREYMAVDMVRSARLAGLPFSMPDPFPVNARLARLVFYRLNARDADLARRFALAVLNRYWGQGQDISELADLAGIAGGLRIDESEIAAAEGDENAKAAVIAATNDAVRDGCFGMPWFMLDGEAFWGHDRLGQMEKRLQETA